MSHLGDNLSAFVDGELSGADLDRASEHLAACGRCRADAAALRALKSELRELARSDDDDDLTGRLLAMASLDGPQSALGSPYRRFEFPAYRSGRRRSLVWGAVSLAVVGGVGAAAFSMGGSAPDAPGPPVVPQVEMFTVQHALTTGGLPVPGPSRTPRHRP